MGTFHSTEEANRVGRHCCLFLGFGNCQHLKLGAKNERETNNKDSFFRMSCPRENCSVKTTMNERPNIYQILWDKFIWWFDPICNIKFNDVWWCLTFRWIDICFVWWSSINRFNVKQLDSFSSKTMTMTYGERFNCINTKYIHT